MKHFRERLYTKIFRTQKFGVWDTWSFELLKFFVIGEPYLHWPSLFGIKPHIEPG